jgi:hypothetical protein
LAAPNRFLDPTDEKVFSMLKEVLLMGTLILLPGRGNRGSDRLN